MLVTLIVPGACAVERRICSEQIECLVEVDQCVGRNVEIFLEDDRKFGLRKQTIEGGREARFVVVRNSSAAPRHGPLADGAQRKQLAHPEGLLVEAVDENSDH